ncbi:MAG: hypothetical protein H0W78_05705 [Planctomycetes bacterium]|jgi:hypothetical protein|nr:hypothetical protein [Planctomycetota bacterium]
MEFARETWLQNPASAWLIKLDDDHVHAGTIVLANAETVAVRSTGRITRLPTPQVTWIRPLIAGEAGGWVVMAGFQAEDTTFDTWWSRGKVLYVINYSEPSGFSDLAQLIIPRHIQKPELVEPPSPAARAQVRPQIARVLDERRSIGVPPIDHLQ